jgi:hypothetical protein
MVPSSRSRTISLISAGILAALSLTAAKGQERPVANTCESARSELSWSSRDLIKMQERLAKGEYSAIKLPDISLSREEVRDFALAIIEIQKSQVNGDLKTVEKEFAEGPIAIGQAPSKLGTLHS